MPKKNIFLSPPGTSLLLRPNSVRFLATDETTPVVMVLLKAKGDPMAITNSPGLKFED